MVREGEVVLFRFPHTDQKEGKLRPALVIRKVTGSHEDWLICMISSQLSQQIIGFDEILSEEDDDFSQSGLKQASVIRIGRLAVVQKNDFVGCHWRNKSSTRVVRDMQRFNLDARRYRGVIPPITAASMGQATQQKPENPFVGFGRITK